MFDLVSAATGVIQSINEDEYTATVKLDEHDEYITKELQILTPLSFANKINCIPAINTPVVVIFFGENQFILNSFNTVENPANKSKGKLVIDFQKTKLELDETGKIAMTTEEYTVNTKKYEITTEEYKLIANNANIEAETSIKGTTGITGDTNITGNADVTASLTAKSVAGDSVKQGNVELGTLKVTGVQGGTGTSGTPVGAI